MNENIFSKDISSNSNNDNDVFLKLQSHKAFKKVIEDEKNKPYFQAAKSDSINLYNLSVIFEEANAKVTDLKKKLNEEFNKAAKITLEKTLPDFKNYNDAYNNAEKAKKEATIAVTKSDDLEKAVLLAEASISTSINNSSAIAAYNVALADAEKAKKEANIAIAKSASLEQEAENSLEQISIATSINADPIFNTFDVILAEYISTKKEADIAYDNSIIAAKKAKVSIQILDMTIKSLIKAEKESEDNSEANADNIFSTFTSFKAKKPELLQAYIQGSSKKAEVLKKIIEEEHNKPYYKDANADEEKAYALSTVAEVAIVKAKFYIAKVEKEYKSEKIANTDFCNVVYNSAKKDAELAKKEAFAAINNANEAANKADSSLLSLEVKIKALVQFAL